MKKAKSLERGLLMVLLSSESDDEIVTNPTCAWIFDSVSKVGISGANVEAQNGGKPVQATTTLSDGTYSFTGLPSATYTFVASKSGYTKNSVTKAYNGTTASLPKIPLTLG